MLKANTEDDGSIGSLAALVMSGSESAITCLGVLFSYFPNLYHADLEMFDAVLQELHNALDKVLPEGINLNLFVEIMGNAIRLERFNKPKYYMEETVKQTMLSFLVDITQEQNQLLQIYEAAGILWGEPKTYSLTIESYVHAKEEMTSEMTFDAVINFLALDNEFYRAPEGKPSYCKNPFGRDKPYYSIIRIKDMRNNPPCLDVIQDQTYDFIKNYTPFFLSADSYSWFWYDEGTKNHVLSAKEPDLTTLLTRHLLSNHRGEWEDLTSTRYLKRLFLLYPDTPLNSVLQNMLGHPIGKIFIQHYLAPNYFPMDYKNDFAQALQSVLDDAYFEEMANSEHLNKYQLLCFYGKGLSLLEAINQSPRHPDYNKLFKEPLHAQHPLAIAVRHNQMSVVNLITDNGQRAFWKIYSDVPLDDRFMLGNALNSPEMVKFLICHNPETMNFASQIDISRVLSASSNLETFDTIVAFLTAHHGFNLADFLTTDCKVILEEPCALDKVTFLDCLLLNDLGFSDEETTRTKTRLLHIKPNHKVSHQVLGHLISEANRQRHSNQRIIEFLTYADPDIIQRSLTNVSFYLRSDGYHKNKNTPLYPYFTDDIWCNFIREGLDTNIDNHIWLTLNEMFTHLTEISDDLQRKMKELFAQEKYKEKSFLLALFNPTLFQNICEGGWIVKARNFIETATSDSYMYDNRETLSSQADTLRPIPDPHLCAQQ